MSDTESGSDASDGIEEVITLQSIKSKKTIYSSISSSYASKWTPTEAFREMVQNWRDGIVNSFKISIRSFHVVTEENQDEIIHKAFKDPPSSFKSSNCLGYIRWYQNNGVGMVEITNKRATLQPQNLDLGASNKGSGMQQAGLHGEGLKLALLVFLRSPQNHSVSCKSGGFLWIFDFSSQGKLCTVLTKPTRTGIQHGFFPTYDDGCVDFLSDLPFHPSPRRDVHFLIGGAGRGRNENGNPVFRPEVSREEFLEWTNGAIFLQTIDEQHNIRTRDGDLITDDKFSGAIYLKGLLLKDSTSGKFASLTGHILKYGYNFASGHTNRERQSMNTVRDETRAILSIWDGALRAQPDQQDLVRQLHEMLNTKTKFADVANAIAHIRPYTTFRLSDYIFSEPFKQNWYYCARETSENHRFQSIVSAFDRTAVELEESYWDILRDAGYLRTAGEEEEKRFRSANAALIPQDTFAGAVHRLLRAPFTCCDQTQRLIVQFVSAGSLGLDTFYAADQRSVKIHDRWLDRDTAIEELGLDHELVRFSDTVRLTVQKLFFDTAQQLPLELFQDESVNRNQTWQRNRAIAQCDKRVAECLRFQEELEIGVTRLDGSDTLVVKWNPKSEWTAGSKILIQAHHQSTCSQYKDILNSKSAMAKRLGLACKNHGCRRDAAVNFSLKSHKFHDMKEADQYFVLISKRSKDESFTILLEDSAVEYQQRAPPPLPPKESFTRGDPVESLDIMAMNWFKAVSSTRESSAVLGIRKTEDQDKDQDPGAHPYKRRWIGY